MLDGHRPKNVKLRQAGSRLRRLWDMEVVFRYDHMYLYRGWEQFIRAYDLRHGYFLVLRYDGNATLTVKVFNTIMCRIRYQDDDDASNGSSSSDSGYSKSSSESGYSKSSSEDDPEWSGEEQEQSGDEEVQPILSDDDLAMVVADDGQAMVVADDGQAMVVADNGQEMVVDDDDIAMLLPEDGLAMVVVPENDLAMVVAPAIPQPGDMTMPIVVEDYIPLLRRSKRIRMMKEKEKKEE
ncbi:hypothetical protein VPH35_095642 [Triticum aestivum]